MYGELDGKNEPHEDDKPEKRADYLFRAVVKDSQTYCSVN